MVSVFASALRLHVRALLGGGGHQKKQCGFPPSVNIDCVVLVVLWWEVREANKSACFTDASVGVSPLSYSYFGTICLGYPLPTVVPCQHLKLL